MKASFRVQLIALYTATALLAACGSSGGGGDNGGGGGGGSTDTTPPTVSSISPSDQDVNVARNPVLTAVFSEAVTNVNGTTFTLSSAGGAVASTVAASGSTATLTPSALLTPSTQYTATITTGAQDAAGNPLAANFTWTFTTTADGTAPTVTGSNLTDGQFGASDTTRVLFNLSEQMNSATINAGTFTLTGPTGLVNGTVTYTDVGPTGTPSATFRPQAPLTSNTQYTASLATGAADVAGNPLAAQFDLSFTTATATLRAFTTPPASAASTLGTVTLINPSDPAAAQSPQAALVNTATNDRDGPMQYLASGSYDPVAKQVRDLHRHAVIFSNGIANGGNIVALSTVTGSIPALRQVSSLSGITNGRGDGSASAAATDLCFTFPVNDFSDVNNSLIVTQQAGPDKTCNSADDALLFFPFSASAAIAPTPFPAGFNLDTISDGGLNITTGAFTGVIAAKLSDGSLVQLSGPGLATQAAVTGTPIGVTRVEKLTELNGGQVVLVVNNELRLYNFGTNTISGALVTLAQAQAPSTHASDGTNFYFTDNVAAGTSVIKRISFANPASPVVNAAFFTGAVGAQVGTIAVSPTGAGRLIFQENGTIKSIPKGGGAVATLFTPAGGPVVFVGVANNPTPARVYANVSTGGFTQGVLGSGTWSARVINEDGTGAATHAGDSRWIAANFGTTVNIFGNIHVARHVVLLTRAAGATDDHAATLETLNAVTHAHTANLGTVPADVAFLGDSSTNTSSMFVAREEGGAKFLLQATYIGGAKQPDVYFVDPLVDGTLLNVGTTGTDTPLDFRNVLD